MRVCLLFTALALSTEQLFLYSRVLLLLFLKNELKCNYKVYVSIVHTFVLSKRTRSDLDISNHFMYTFLLF